MNKARGTEEHFNISSQLQGTFSEAKIKNWFMVLRRVLKKASREAADVSEATGEQPVKRVGLISQQQQETFVSAKPLV